MVSGLDKAKQLYSKIADNHYMCRDDLTVGENKYNSHLLFGVLTELTKGNQLVYGEYGGGKTTSSECLHSLFNGLPLDLVKSTVLRGHPHLTPESMIALPNYGAIHTNDSDWSSEPLWLPFVMMGPKIIDEFNRIPEPTQSIVLNGVERGDWDYLRAQFNTGKVPFFATANYADSGNNTIIPPILDRFDVCTESRYPGIANVISISNDYGNEHENILTDPEAKKKAMEILTGNGKFRSYEDVLHKLEAECLTDFRAGLEKNGYPVITDEDRRTIRDEISAIQITPDAEIYFMMIASEMSLHPQFGLKRSVDPTNKDHGLFLNSTFIGSGSRRSERGLLQYAAALAWLEGDKSVGVNQMAAVAPYTLWHKLNFNGDTKSQFADEQREDPLNMYITKTLLGHGTSQIPGVMSRFAQIKKPVSDALNLIHKGDLVEAKSYLDGCYNNGKGHPIFYDLRQDLE